MNTRPITSLSLLDGFDRYFVEAVLRIQGVNGLPTTEQVRSACAQLDGYYAAVMRAPEPAHTDDEEDWLDSHTFTSAAAELAFLYTQFGVIDMRQATTAETAAFKRWWLSGVLPGVLATSAA